MWGEGCAPSLSTQKSGWKICAAVCVSSVATTSVTRSRWRYRNAAIRSQSSVRPAARAAAHEQLELGQAERVLHVDQEQRRAAGVLHRRADPVPRRPRPRLGRALLVRHAVDAARGRGVEERRERQAHGLTSRVQATSGWITRPEGSLGWKKVLLAGIDSPASATSTICDTGVARISTARRHGPVRQGLLGLGLRVDVAHRPVAARRGGARAPRGAGSRCRARGGRPGSRARAVPVPRLGFDHERALPRLGQREGVGRGRGRHRGDRRGHVRSARQPEPARQALPRLVERRPLGEDPVVGLHDEAGRLDRREVAERPGAVGADRVAVAERRRVAVVPVGDVRLHAAEERLEAADEAGVDDAPHAVADPAVVGVLRHGPGCHGLEHERRERATPGPGT